MQRPAIYAQPIGLKYSSAWTPSWMVEAGYYLYMFNAVFGSLWGITVPLIGGGATIAGLAAICLWRLKSELKKLLSPIALLLGCAISFIVIQIVFHEESITGDSVRSFVIWILGLVLVRSLCLRPGLGHRFILVLFTIGLIALPYIGFKVDAERAYVAEAVSGNLSNANGLGEWFGFCAVYFAVLGLETRRGIVRILSFSAAALCLFVVGLTVSRGALAATAIGLVIASRRILKRGFMPLLVLIVLAWIVTELGIFQNILSHYMQRGTEDTGRLRIWAEALQGFFDSPLVGMGASNSSVSLQGSLSDYTTHNSFFYFALASGTIPLIFFVWFWIRTIRRSLVNVDQFEYGPFRTPLLLFLLVTSLTGDLGFMFPAGLLGVVIGGGVGVGYRTSQHFLMVSRNEERRIYKLVRRRPQSATPVTRS